MDASGLGGSTPWQPPRGGGEGTASIPAGALGPAPSASGTSQSGGSGGSTGQGGIFAEWPGRTFQSWPQKGLFGGLGDRGQTR